MSHRKLGWTVVVLMPFVAVGYLLYSWGLGYYFLSIIEAPTPSPNANKRAGTLMFNGAKKGSALLVHGLNFEADKLLPLGMVLHQAGFQVYLPRLAGHRGDLAETFFDVKPTWQSQFDEFHREYGTLGVCAGYSMGGLLVLERFLAGRIQCERFVLFAPALASYTPEAGARFLRWLLPRKFEVRSGIPGDYKHFDHLGLSPTWALIEVLSEFRQQLGRLDRQQAMPPGLVFLDKRDRVIDAAAVRQILTDYFPNWRIVDVEALPLPESHAYHMFIDEPHVGPNQWAAITNEIGTFLKQ